MIASTQITDIEILAFIAVLVFKLMSHKVCYHSHTQQSIVNLLYILCSKQNHIQFKMGCR